MTAKRDRRVTRECEICTALFHPWQGRPGRTCSRPCSNALVSRETAIKRGDTLRGDSAGYVKRNGRHEHRVVAERMIGRPLEPGEIVHHRNGNKGDNRPENLEVLPSQAEHARQHGRKCEPDCTCGRHNAYARTPEHRARMSAAVTAAIARKDLP